MAKRSATTELNHDNWNDELPVEEAGTFRTASSEVTSKRVLKKAKRRLGGNSESSSVFKGFSGFTSLKSTGSGSPFDKLLTSDSFKSGFQSDTSSLNITPFVIGSETKFDQSLVSSNEQYSRGKYLQLLRNLNESILSWISQQVDNSPIGVLHPIFNEYNNYLRQLKQKCSQGESMSKKELSLQCKLFTKYDLVQLRRLNEAVVEWIKLHVGKNPVCILTPIFDDYSKYVKQFEEKYLKTNTKVSNEQITVGTPLTSFKFGFENNTPQTFVGTNNEDDDYVPPKTEVQVVKEDDAFYSVRCKLFYKKDGKYTEKGVGTLYLKCIDGKTQLLVRAETNLGLHLLNVYVVPEIPTCRVGKNNVNLVCIPHPPLNPKVPSTEPVTFLLRVKDEAEADQLLEKLEQSKM